VSKGSRTASSDTCLSTNAYVIERLCRTINRQAYLILLGLKPNEWIMQMIGPTLMYLTCWLSWIAYWQQHVGMNALSRLGWQHWAAACHHVSRQQCFQKQSKLYISTQQALAIQNSSVTCVNELGGIRCTKCTGRQNALLLSEQHSEHCKLTRRLSVALRLEWQHKSH